MGRFVFVLFIITVIKGTQFSLLFAITSADVVPCDGRKSLPVHHP